MSGIERHAVGRRAVLGTGLAAGAGALLLGTTVSVSGATAVTSGPTGRGSTGDDRPGEAAGGLAALPAQIAGAQMIGIYGTAFYTMGYGSTDQVTVLFASGKGAHASGPGIRLFVRLPVLPGSRIVRLDYYGYRDAAGSQTWWLTRRDPTTFTVADLTSDTLNGTGALTAARLTNELVLPGYDYSVAAQTSSGDPYVRGAVVQFFAPAGDFYPITPARVYDSRVNGGRLGVGGDRVVFVATELGVGATVVPSGARAVALNLTVDQTAGAGFLSLRPAGTPWAGTSSINWSQANATVANGSTCLLGGDREITVLCGGTAASTHFILDVVGYYL